jgi:hypothetical protein
MRTALLLALMGMGHAALAADCGPRLARADIDALAGELHRGVVAISMYRVAHGVIQDATVLHERVGRAGVLAEIRDAVRHAGERSFVEFKLSHEASLLKDISAGVHGALKDLLAGVRAESAAEIARLRDAAARAEKLFAPCDSPM